jgi:RNA polymerase sigma-70 factor, ECF subfamily
MGRVRTITQVLGAAMTARPLDSDGTAQTGQAPSATAALPTPEQLFRTRAEFVWRVVTANGVRQADAPDVTQEVFLIAFDKLGEFDPGRGSLDTWLYGIAARVAANHRRKAHLRRETHAEPDDDVPLRHQSVQVDPGDGIDKARLLHRLDTALAAMDSAKRDVFVMFEIGGVTMQEIALASACNLKTAYGRLYAARRELAALFGGAKSDGREEADEG